jgi:hypothetical protein
MNKKNWCYKMRNAFEDFLDLENIADLKTEEAVPLSIKKAVEQRRILWQDYKEQVMRLMQEWHNDASFLNKLRIEDDGRLIVRSNLAIENKDYFPALIKRVLGKLAVKRSSLPQVDFIEKVGSLILEDATIGSFSRLSSLQYLNCRRVDIESFPKLKQIRGKCFVSSSSVSFPALERAQGIDIKNSNVASFTNLLICEGNLRLKGVRGVEKFPYLKSVGKALIISGESDMRYFPELEKIGEIFLLSGMEIDDFRQAFPQLHTVGSSKGTFSQVSVKSAKVARQIEKLVEKGELTIPDDIFFSQ